MERHKRWNRLKIIISTVPPFSGSGREKKMFGCKQVKPIFKLKCSRESNLEPKYTLNTHYTIPYHFTSHECGYLVKWKLRKMIFVFGFCTKTSTNWPCVLDWHLSLKSYVDIRTETNDIVPNPKIIWRKQFTFIGRE